MRNREEAYIGIELETHEFQVDLGSSAEQDILDEGIDISARELYEFIYDNGYHCSDEKLKMMLDDFENTKNMLYPLSCHYNKETSYADWLEYEKWRDEEREKQREKEIERLNTLEKQGE